MTQLDKSLVKKYLENQCSLEEVNFIENFVKANPEAIDQILAEKEWMAFIATYNSTNHSQLSPAQFRIRFNNLKQKIQKGVSFHFFKIAALMILCMSLFFFIYLLKVKQHSKAKDESEITVRLIHQKNDSNKKQTLQIEDGSIITLSPGSILTYLKPLQEDKREFLLEGEGVFEVAKDSLRPFIVEGGGLTTTALGTKFQVKAIPYSGETIVNLLEGKIKVSASHSTINHAKEYYLTVGDQILFNQNSLTVGLINKETKSSIASEPIKKLNKEHIKKIRYEINEEYISFDNEHLINVLNLLNEELSAHIEFNPKEIKGIYFSGEFQRKSILENLTNDQEIIKEILSTVSTLNHLILIEKNEGYKLSKSNSNQLNNK